MKIKEGYLLREVAGTPVVMPLGNVDFSGMITLNETGKLLWERLEQGATESELLTAITSEFDVSDDVAKADISAFLDTLRAQEILCE